jgi:hypothetical protein
VAARDREADALMISIDSAHKKLYASEFND